MARVSSKVGDIFVAKIDDNYKKYMQYVANDLTQLNSDVIRVFKKCYPIDSNPDMSQVVKDEVEFYVHCIVNLGTKLGLWEKVGKIVDIGKVEVLFRGTNDYGYKLGEEPIKVSYNWYIWKINDEHFTHVGSLSDENKKSEIGIVVNPKNIVHRMRTGRYSFNYPL